ncbi:hypothetical protein BJ508DRAFT_315988 [Ascobolus immersus RN42]|uniref:Uncharacterized protein n=1 Tax=Ascobolus immersus RN42 TaxID=1160509 RepID=A0A3N4H8A6_ASCIM|nr:hypothetical protein BJ508DRAFT_315988 [Ascobolus immersus RN42]
MSQRSINLPPSLTTGRPSSRNGLLSESPPQMNEQYVQASRQQLSRQYSFEPLAPKQPASAPPPAPVPPTAPQHHRRHRRTRQEQYSQPEQYAPRAPKKHQQRTHIPYRPGHRNSVPQATSQQYPPQPRSTIQQQLPASLSIHRHAPPLPPVTEASFESGSRSDTPRLPVETAFHTPENIAAYLAQSQRPTPPPEAAHPPHEDEDIAFITPAGTLINMFTYHPEVAYISVDDSRGNHLRLAPGEPVTRIFSSFVYQEWHAEPGTEHLRQPRLVQGRSFRYRVSEERKSDAGGRERVSFLDVWCRRDGRVGVAYRNGWIGRGGGVEEDAF